MSGDRTPSSLTSLNKLSDHFTGTRSYRTVTLKIAYASLRPGLNRLPLNTFPAIHPGLIARIRDRGVPVVLISHDMPHVFEVADRIQIMRLGRRAALTTPQQHTMSEVVAIMTGAARGDESVPDPNQTMG